MATENIPKVSVLMPVYNTKEEYLRDAIESVLNQTFMDFEFIILNDGSTNNAEEVILSYKDDRIKYIKNDQNLNLIATLNKGLDIAVGKYIARMDSDDTSLPQRLEKQVEFLDKNLDIDILGTSYKRIPKGKIIKHPISNYEIKMNLLFHGCVISHPTVMIRKEKLDRLGYRYNENDKHAEDYGLWLSMINEATFANLPEVLLYYRVHNENISVLHSETQFENANRLRIEAQQKFLEIDAENIWKIANKVTLRQKITSDECSDLVHYFEELVDKMPDFENKKDCIADIISEYRLLMEISERNKQFADVLWNNKLNKLMKNNFYFKIRNSIMVWNKEGKNLWDLS